MSSERLSAQLFRGQVAVSASSLLKWHHDQFREKIQPDRERCPGSTLGKAQVQHLPPGSTKIKDHYSPQAISPNVKQGNHATPTKN